MEYIASCSFGKDSIATIILAHINGDPIDEIVFSEVMYDHSRDISGELPEHIDFIHNVAIPKFESWGYKVTVVRGKTDYLQQFHRIKIRGKWKGKKQGFPIGNMCTINRDCKTRPIHRYFKGRTYIQYIGIAIDEPKRLKRLTGNKVSLLQKYNYTEQMAKELCEEYGLLSPIYKSNSRGGCWFCPNARINEFYRFRAAYPELWQELIGLSKTDNLCSKKFKWGKTIEEIDYKLRFKDLEQDLFKP